MGKPLSTDLRSRLVAAVAGGMSRRAAAKRFGVAPASAVRWVHASTTTGTIAPNPDRIKNLYEVGASHAWLVGGFIRLIGQPSSQFGVATINGHEAALLMRNNGTALGRR